MARSFEEIVKAGISRALYIEKVQAAAPKRKPARTMTPPLRGTLYALRNKRIAIREAALRLVQAVVTYTKVTDGTTHKYIVAPYSWRYRRLRTGLRKMLYAWDMEDRKIKSFSLASIRNVALTDRKFVPKWQVEIFACVLLPLITGLFSL